MRLPKPRSVDESYKVSQTESYLENRVGFVVGGDYVEFSFLLGCKLRSKFKDKES